MRIRWKIKRTFCSSDLSDDQESTGQMRLRRKRKGTRRNYADDAGESDSSENAEQPKTTTRKIG